MPKKFLKPFKTVSPNPLTFSTIQEDISFIPFHKPFTMFSPMPFNSGKFCFIPLMMFTRIVFPASNSEPAKPNNPSIIAFIIDGNSLTNTGINFPIALTIFINNSNALSAIIGNHSFIAF